MFIPIHSQNIPKIPAWQLPSETLEHYLNFSEGKSASIKDANSFRAIGQKGCKQEKSTLGQQKQ